MIYWWFFNITTVCFTQLGQADNFPYTTLLMFHDVFITVCIFPIKENKISIQNEIYYSNKYIVQD